jgi:hypothetical protein
MNDTAYPPSSAWEEERGKLLNQLDEVQFERAQLRTYLQLADTQDPRDVVERFNKLNVSIKNACLLSSTAVLKSVQKASLLTTKNAKNFGQLQKDLGDARALVLSQQGAGRGLEEFLPQAFSYIVNLALVNDLFSLFHPGLSMEESMLLSDVYHNIRRRGLLHILSQTYFKSLLYTSRSSASFSSVALFDL